MKANVGHMGLYRVNYDQENWELLGNQLTHNHKVSKGKGKVVAVVAAVYEGYFKTFFFAHCNFC